MPVIFYQSSDDVFSSAIVFGAILLSLAVLVGVVVVTYRRIQTAKEAWEQLAMRTGLSYRPGGFMDTPSLSGEFRRRQMSLDSFTRRVGRNRIRYTRVTLSPREPVSGSFNLQSRGLLTGMGRMLGMQDIPTGSERFDKTFVVRGSPPELAQTAFSDPMLQSGLVRLRERANFTLELKSNTMTYTQRGLPTDTDYLSEVFNTMSDLADRLDGGLKGGLFGS